MRRLCQRECDFLLQFLKQKIVVEAFSENFFKIVKEKLS